MWQSIVEEVLSTISAQDISHKMVVLISNFLTIKNCVFLSVIKLNKIKILFNLGELKTYQSKVYEYVIVKIALLHVIYSVSGIALPISNIGLSIKYIGLMHLSLRKLSILFFIFVSSIVPVNANSLSLILNDAPPMKP